MRFALLGSHPHGLELSRCLTRSSRHELVAYLGPSAGKEWLSGHGVQPKSFGDLEEILADPVIEMVIVAAELRERTALLRRSLQSERHVLCIHPADDSPDIAYEAAMIQADTRMVLLPLLFESFHPAILRLAELVQGTEKALGTLQVVELDYMSEGAALLEAGSAWRKPSFPGWDVLRALGGEIAEVSAIAGSLEVSLEEPVLLAGCFEQGGLFRAALLPQRRESRCRLQVVGTSGEAEVVWPDGWPGPALLQVRNANGEWPGEQWDSWSPWEALVATFEATVSGNEAATGKRSSVRHFSWQDEIRSLELDDAARRSLERRRTSTLEYQEATEEAGFKGTMTLVGCALLWLCLILVILSVWVPWMAWLVLPALLGFLGLQVLRWVVPVKEATDRPS